MVHFIYNLDFWCSILSEVSRALLVKSLAVHLKQKLKSKKIYLQFFSLILLQVNEIQTDSQNCTYGNYVKCVRFLSVKYLL